MAFVIADRTRDTSSAQSSTLVTLSNSPPTGFQSFNSGIGDGNTCFYTVTDGTNWEDSYGVYTNAGTTLARAATPISSSNGGAQVVTFSGTVSVFVSPPAALFQAQNIGLQSGRLYHNYGYGTTTTSATPSTGTVRYIPIFISKWFTSVPNIHINISSLGAATGTYAVGLYSNLNSAPNKRLGQVTGLICGNQGGGATGDNASGSITMPSPQPPGLYWAAVVFATTAPSLVQTNGASTTSAVIGFMKVVAGLPGFSTTNISELPGGWSEVSATLPATASATPTIINTASVPLMGVEVS